MNAAVCSGILTHQGPINFHPQILAEMHLPVEDKKKSVGLHEYLDSFEDSSERSVTGQDVYKTIKMYNIVLCDMKFINITLQSNVALVKRSTTVHSACENGKNKKPCLWLLVYTS